MKNKQFLAFAFIFIGLVMLFRYVGNIFPYWLSGYIIPIAFLLFGYYGVKSGRAIIGTIMIVIGGILLLIKLSWIIGLVIAIGLVFIGFGMLSKKS
ncbi:hypothetical protein [Longirhabdus pacifica]|uniref:hypothetical protein n=1 Tax=Longirhabdus pacifica TaxID=2305227 RepID=UPI001008A4CF|nr:hypothetical protein [Longirhabdus pacifica]